jgi:hypothetical protein
MNKTLVLLTLPSLLTACLEPNPIRNGGSNETEATETGSVGESSGGTPNADDTGDDPPSDDDGDDTSGGAPEPETTSDGETAGSDSGESGTVEPEPNCDLETHQCISAVPDGWSGPIAQLDASDPTGCAGFFSESVLDTFADVFADPAACTCECGSPSGGTCAETTIVDFYSEITFFGETYNETTCEAVTFGDLALEYGDIFDFPSGYEDYDVRVIGTTPAVETVGSCNVATETSEVSEPTLVGERVACMPTDPLTACDAETVCVPKAAAPFEAGVCIWAEGDVECPADTDFTQREVRGAGVVDNRSCSGCSCDPASGQACDDAIVRLWRTGGWVDRSIDDECNGANLGPGNTWTGVSFDPGDPSGGSCVADGGEPEGEVAPAAAITFCCT